jgi:PhnB protein
VNARDNLVPYIAVSDAAAAIAFYQAAFGAEVRSKYAAPNSDKLMHVSLRINGSLLALTDDFSAATGVNWPTPEELGGSAVMFHMQVEDADAAWEREVAAGAEVLRPLADEFWGGRYGELRDPFGHRWSLWHPIAKLTQAEVEQAPEGAAESDL